jgi:hypothetical protein
MTKQECDRNGIKQDRKAATTDSSDEKISYNGNIKIYYNTAYYKLQMIILLLLNNLSIGNNIVVVQQYVHWFHWYYYVQKTWCFTISTTRNMVF